MTKPVKQGADLEGKLCGVSHDSLAHAKWNAENLKNIQYVEVYGNAPINNVIETNEYETYRGEYRYAYPVSDERIEQMKSGA